VWIIRATIFFTIPHLIINAFMPFVNQAERDADSILSVPMTYDLSVD